MWRHSDILPKKGNANNATARNIIQTFSEVTHLQRRHLASCDRPTCALTTKDLVRILSLDRYGLQPDRVLTGDGVVGDSPVVVVEDGMVSSCTPAADASNIPGDLEVMRLVGATIVPGVVDTHHHVTLPFAKGLTFGEPAQLWRRVWMPLEAEADATTDYYGAKWTFVEALRGGFTTIVDSATRSLEQNAAVLRAADETGIRLVTSSGIFDLQDFDGKAAPPMDGTVAAAIAKAEAHVDMCSNHVQATPSIACGTIQSNSRLVIETLAAWCAERGVLFQIHANEHTAEVHRSIERYGQRPIELLDTLGVLGSHVLIAHASLVTPAELTRLAETDTAVSYNPVASQWKGNGAASALLFDALGIRFGLGTDNTRNDAFRLIDAAESTYRVAHSIGIDDFVSGSGKTWWRAATVGGARAAGLYDVGEIKPGYRADFLVLDSSTPETMPSWDLIWELCRLYDRSNIRAVVVGGKARVVEGKPVGWDLAEFMEEALDVGLAQMNRAQITSTHSDFSSDHDASKQSTNSARTEAGGAQ